MNLFGLERASLRWFCLLIDWFDSSLDILARISCSLNKVTTDEIPSGHRRGSHGQLLLMNYGRFGYEYDRQALVYN